FTSELKSAVSNNKKEKSLLNDLPLTRLITYLKQRAATTLEKTQDHENTSGEPGNANGRERNTPTTSSSEGQTYNDKSTITYVVNRYLTNKKLIEAVTSVYRVRPVFVWQPIPAY